MHKAASLEKVFGASMVEDIPQQQPTLGRVLEQLVPPLWLRQVGQKSMVAVIKKGAAVICNFKGRKQQVPHWQSVMEVKAAHLVEEEAFSVFLSHESTVKQQ